MDLKALAVKVGIPLVCVTVFAAILKFAGIDLPTVEAIAGGMLGLQLVIALLIDIAKTTGAVDDDTAGKWSAALNIGVIVFVAVMLYLNPAFDFGKLDAQIKVFADAAALLVALILQLLGTKSFHQALVDGLQINAFSFKYR